MKFDRDKFIGLYEFQYGALNSSLLWSRLRPT